MTVICCDPYAAGCAGASARGRFFATGRGAPGAYFGGRPLPLYANFWPVEAHVNMRGLGFLSAISGSVN
jgi:hypothetical protein